jgi:hypothetical protein
MPLAMIFDDRDEIVTIIEALEQVVDKKPIHERLLMEWVSMLESFDSKGGESHERLSRKADRGVP